MTTSRRLTQHGVGVDGNGIITLTLIFILLLISFTDGLEVECHGHQSQFKVEDADGNLHCQECTRCPPGQGVYRECSEYSDTVCVPCTPGTSFSPSTSVDDICQPCTICSPNQYITRNCTVTRNSHCGKCKIGYFLDELSDFCEACWYCYPGISNYISDCDVPDVAHGYHCMQINNPPYPPPAPTLSYVQATSKHYHVSTQKTSVFAVTLNVNHLESIKRTVTPPSEAVTEGATNTLPSKTSRPNMLVAFTIIILVVLIIIAVSFIMRVYCRRLKHNRGKRLHSNSISKDIVKHGEATISLVFDRNEVGHLGCVDDKCDEVETNCLRKVGCADNVCNNWVECDLARQVGSVGENNSHIECPDENCPTGGDSGEWNSQDTVGEVQMQVSVPIHDEHLSKDNQPLLSYINHLHNHERDVIEPCRIVDNKEGLSPGKFVTSQVSSDSAYDSDGGGTGVEYSGDADNELLIDATLNLA